MMNCIVKLVGKNKSLLKLLFVGYFIMTMKQVTNIQPPTTQV